MTNIKTRKNFLQMTKIALLPIIQTGSYKTKPVGGASCPAVMALETAETFSMVNPKDHMVKTSPAFLLCLIDTVRYTA